MFHSHAANVHLTLPDDASSNIVYFPVSSLSDNDKNKFLRHALGAAPHVRLEHLEVAIPLFHQYTVPNHRTGQHWHRHPWAEFSLVSSGVVKYRTETHAIHASAGTFIFIPAGTTHCWEVAAMPAVIDGFFFDFQPLDPIGEAWIHHLVERTTEIGYAPTADPGIIACFKEIDGEAFHQDAHAAKRIELLVTDIVCRLLRNNFSHKTQTANPGNGHGAAFSLFEKCRKWIRRELAAGIRARDVAKAMDCTPRYLNMVFVKVSGKPCGQYIKEERLTAAYRALCHSEGRRIREVSESCGFRDYYVFSHAFKRRFGLSPKRLRDVR